MPFTFKKLNIPEVILVEAQSFPDDRGYFKEIFKESSFIVNGINTKFVQDNFSFFNSSNDSFILSDSFFIACSKGNFSIPDKTLWW